MSEQEGFKTVHQTAEDYGDKHADHLLEQYKLFVEMADRISARRQAANNFYLSVSSALVVLYSIVSTDDTGGGAVAAWQYAVPAVGVAVCIMWGLLIRSYRTLNSGKYQVVHDIEAQLPARPYDAEWEYLKRGKTKMHIPFTAVEIWLPVFFGILYGFLAARPFIGGG